MAGTLITGSRTLDQIVLGDGDSIRANNWSSGSIHPSADAKAVATMAGDPNLTFAETGDTITRSAGSWITDGFAVGMFVDVESASNDMYAQPITALTATVMTLGSTALVNEGPTNGHTVTGHNAFITSENYLDDGAEHGPVMELEIDGDEDISEFPHGEADSEQSEPTVMHGAMLDCSRIGQVRSFCHIHHIRGIAVDIISSLGLNAGIIAFNDIHHVHTGIRVRNSDTVIWLNNVNHVKNYCLHIDGTPGNIQSIGNHYYAAITACLNEQGQHARFQGDSFADSQYGYVGEAGSDYATFTNCLIQNCYRNGMSFASTHNKVHDCTIRVPYGKDQHNAVTGVLITQVRNSITDSLFDFNANLSSGDTGTTSISTGVKVAASNCEISNVMFENFLAELNTIPSRAVWLSGAIDGFIGDYKISHFNGTGDILLKADGGANCNNIDVTIHGNSVDDTDFDHTDLATYLDVAAGWSGSIIIVDDATGNFTTAVEGTAY